MTHFTRLALSLALAIPACGFPRPPTITDDAATADAAAGGDSAPGVDAAGGDAAVSIDARPGTTIHVAGTGDDSNDGITAPVKTLKHAIGLAAANDQITSIVLASGRYASAAGETFPYTLPANIILSGPAGGGAILAGTDTEPGMIVDAGALQDIELEHFSVAVIATGLARLSNVRVRTAALAIRAESTAKLTVDNLDITGAGTACAKGVVLIGAAQLVAGGLATRNLGMTLDVPDQTTASLTGANISGTRTCAGAVIRANTTKTFAMTDGLVDNGEIGVQLFGQSGQPAPHATITNTILRNMKVDGIGGGDGVTLTVTGGTLSNNGNAGFEGGGGNYSFIGVSFQQNLNSGLYYAGNALPPSQQTLKMRGCTVDGQQLGVWIDDGAYADLGTAEIPGNNRFFSVQTVGLNIGGGTVPRVDAVGNTWRPNVQGADANGKYPASTSPVTGVVPMAPSSNYAISRVGVSLYL